ncbi:hypothetical protein [Promicromonospora soli]|uniref:hypothetical protein n=1 Tax=Promicromonospora soli TaxID=2035533 RepID=UPI001677241D|nr:hypothetical protein [Promicromonospora soli]
MSSAKTPTTPDELPHPTILTAALAAGNPLVLAAAASDLIARRWRRPPTSDPRRTT